MAQVELKLFLPHNLARQAEANGLLTVESIEALQRNELKRHQQINQLFDAADRLAALHVPPLSETKLQVEIEALRNA